MSLIETPLSKTIIDYETRWKNKVFLREVQRQRRHGLGLKQRMRVLDDGKKYVDVYPNVNKQKYYEPRPKQFCEVCKKQIYQGNYARHLQSKEHATFGRGRKSYSGKELRSPNELGKTSHFIQQGVPEPFTNLSLVDKLDDITF